MCVVMMRRRRQRELQAVYPEIYRALVTMQIAQSPEGLSPPFFVGAQHNCICIEVQVWPMLGKMWKWCLMDIWISGVQWQGCWFSPTSTPLDILPPRAQ